MFKQHLKHAKCRKKYQQELKAGFEVDSRTSFECQEKDKALHLAGNKPVKRYNLAPGGEKALQGRTRGPGDAEPGATPGSCPF